MVPVQVGWREINELVFVRPCVGSPTFAQVTFAPWEQGAGDIEALAKEQSGTAEECEHSKMIPE